MSREQWGHGYHAGMAEASKKLPAHKTGLVGKWFHSFHENGRMNWQGQVLSVQGEDLLLVQLYSWLSGHATDQKLVKMSDALGWSFYSTEEDMRETYQNKYAQLYAV